jgi:hypothetical protein
LSLLCLYSAAHAVAAPENRSAAWTVSLEGEIRERFESTRNGVFGLVDAPDSDALLHRASLSIGGHRNEGIGAKLQLIGALTSGWDGDRSPVQDNSFDVLQAYAHATFAIADTTVNLRVGRQELALGASRLVSVRESPNVRRAFDGIRGTWVLDDALRVDAFVLRPVQPELGALDDRSSSDQTFSGLYGTFVLDALPGQVETYYLYLNRRRAAFAQATASETRHTLGMRLAGEGDAIDWNIEGAWQWGSFGAAAIRAWTLSVDLGYRWASIALAPRIGLKVNLISGDRDLDDDTLGTFNPLFPKLPYFSDANLVTPANLSDLQPNLTLRLAPNVTAAMSWNVLWKFARADAFYAPPLSVVPGTATSKRHSIGHQTSVSIAWQATGSLSIAGSYVYFEPGSVARSAGGVDGSFAAAWVQLRF